MKLFRFIKAWGVYLRAMFHWIDHYPKWNAMYGSGLNREGRINPFIEHEKIRPQRPRWETT